MRQLTVVGLVLLVGSRLSADPEIKGTAPELAQFVNGIPRTVAVTGEAEVRVPAHRAILNLNVVTEDKSLKEALRMNRDLRASLTGYLNGFGIPQERIQASKFSSTPKFGIFREKAKSYRVENAMRVSVQDEKEFQGVASAVDKWDEVRFVGVEFEYADKELQKENAIAKACDNADERKKIYESKLGLTLTPVRFGQNEIMQRNATPANYANFRAYSAMPVGAEPAVAESVAGPAAVDGSVSSFGEMIYTAAVTVEYSVKPK